MAEVKSGILKGSKVIKASSWYIICSFATNALSFITAPIFTRIMPKAAYGEYSNFVSWYGIITCLATLNLQATIMRAKYDFKDEFKSYVSSMLLLGAANTLGMYVIVFIFRDIFTQMLSLNMFYISMIFLCLVFQPANAIFQTVQRLEYKYKTSVFLTLSMAVLTSGISVLFVLNWNDKLMAKVMGAQMPALAINIGLFLFLLVQGRKMRFAHWKYAYVIALPYVPHLLAGTMLNSLDRVMITNMRGTEETATYSVAGNCALIMSIFSTSMNMAIQPWMVEKIHNKEHEQVKKIVNTALLLFTLICGYLIIFAKEIILIIGGKNYSSAVGVIPPLVIGCLFQFIYTFYVNVEQFEKKTFGMAMATLATALLNWGLNWLFIPQYGYMAAAYTTAVSYFFLLAVHYVLVRRLGQHIFFDTKVILELIAAICLFTVLVLNLPDYIRYGVIILMTGIIIYLGIKVLKTIRQDRS